ncbi:MAG: bifunctional UDP-N-acetylglucosamine diphosphorylase/glucosamine-1-phosphate N-acetyltransferase GlmU [Alphaproteobacteria bacterium]|nr:bifunctional UDP-N-acetylglucosamine diphosphorylase/glucosamine-1-phosphate N-acetyltransferase GlmU [Alphaproteobacteria bacterium]
MAELALVVLAAGMGTRMKSAIPKVLHKIAGRSMLSHVLHAGKELGAAKVVVIHGPDMPGVLQEARGVIPNCQFSEQRERLGTGHAVSMAKEALAGFKGTVLTLWGDAPLVKADTLRALAAKIDAKHRMAVLAFEAENPFGYGRMITKGKAVLDIREQLDASPAERKIRLCNSGYIAIDNELLWQIIPKLSNKNAKGEFYLTDLVKLANKAKTKVALATCDEMEVAGVNDRAQLSVLEREYQREARRAAMAGGATLIDPDTVYFSADTKLGKDVVVEPNVFFGPGVVVGDDVEILANSHIEGTVISSGARIGPFARLRPGAEIGENAHIGNFVEVKKAVIGKGAKANHLTYIGDAVVGAGSNIGAGTITCNYDGYEKHLTEIGENVFVGSNTSLVAPVKVGAGSNIAASSVITREIPPDSLAVSRPELIIKEGWAKRYRSVKKALKDAKAKGKG